MQLAKLRTATGVAVYGALEGDGFYRFAGPPTLGEFLALPDVEGEARRLRQSSHKESPIGLKLLAPVDRQEIWAAGVTYKRSKIAREEESAGAAQFYDKVYSAERPELFLKCIAEKVVHPGDPVRIRADGKWNVPEPELTLVVAPNGTIVGYTIGNDMSSRDIEGENPLYLPQAKIYTGSCAVGPAITLASAIGEVSALTIRIAIERSGKRVFEGETSFGQFHRTPRGLVDWLTKENDFPHGALLMTGTGIVPPDEFTLASGDAISITIDGIGTLANAVA